MTFLVIIYFYAYCSNGVIWPREFAPSITHVVSPVNELIIETEPGVYDWCLLKIERFEETNGCLK